MVDLQVQMKLGTLGNVRRSGGISNCHCAISGLVGVCSKHKYLLLLDWNAHCPGQQSTDVAVIVLLLPAAVQKLVLPSPPITQTVHLNSWMMNTRVNS
jgi:hypothetical protein